jgi:hypothetical protein
MDTREARRYIGDIRLNFLSLQISADEAISQLQNIDLESIEENSMVPKESLQAAYNNTLELLKSKEV